jgi:hypothetical protein
VCRKVLAFNPNDFAALSNLALSLYRCGCVGESIDIYRRALALGDEYPVLRASYGTALLAHGEFDAGWPEYEYGLLCDEREPRFQDLPRWQGESLDGKTLLVCAEQGLGDELMFASIMPEVIAEAAHCVIECDVRLMPIYQRSFPSATILRRRLPADDTAREAPPVDLQVPVGSLPLYRRRHLADFPKHSGYLKVDPGRVAYWKKRLDELGQGMKVGLSWRGGLPKTGRDRRSIPLAEWLPILRMAGVQFVSLQYTDCKAELAEFEQVHGIRVTHWQEGIDDYDETAALVGALDQIVTVQTAIFHLAGALGRPVWGLIPIPAEWRYLQAGETVPWYPSARLFRQSVRGDWTNAVGQVEEALGQTRAGIRRIT